MTETAVIVRVREAEPAIGRHQREHTPAGAEGVPPRVTVLYPFVDSAELVGGLLRELRETLAELAPFRFSIVRLARFAEAPSVLYGAPEPVAPFVGLTERLCDRFRLLPYGGRHTTVIPHVTIAMELTAAEYDRIEAVVEPHLPVQCSADACELWERTDSGWRLMDALPLSGRAPVA